MKTPPRLVIACLSTATLFAIRPDAAAQLIDPAGATATSNFNAGRDIANAINGNGLIDLGGSFGHSIAPEPNMWLAAQGVDTPSITIDLGAVHSVDTMRVWNYNERLPDRDELLLRGVASANVSAGETLDGFSEVLTEAEFAMAPGAEDVDFSEEFDLDGVRARFVRIDVLSNHGDSFTGLSEVQFDGELVGGGGDGPIPVAGVTASSNINDNTGFDRLADYTIDGSGLFAGMFHSIAPQPNMWLGVQGDLMPTITYDLGSVQQVGFMRLWNYNEAANATCCLGRGIAQADILVSEDDVDYTPLLEDRPFEIAPGLDTVDFSEDVALNTSARYVRIAVDQNHGDSGFTGLSEVQFFPPQEDSDNDMLPDAYEQGIAGNLTDLDGTKDGPGPGAGTGDFDGDMLNDLGEFNRGTDPTDPDTDGDTLVDGAEVEGAGDRPPTNPREVDTDGDTLEDSVESNTRVFIDLDDTGTDPTSADTDGDGTGDAEEIAEPFTDPNDPEDFPPVTLVGYWPFDEDVDPQPDLSGFANDAMVNGAATWSLDAERDSGVMQFAGGPGLQAAHAESLTIEGGITITAWVKPSQTEGWDGIIAKNPFDDSPPNHAGNYELRLHTAGRHMEFLWEQGNPASTTAVGDGGNGVPDSVWTHVAFAGEPGGNYTFYINGEPTGTGAFPDSFAGQNTNPLYIGNRADASTVPWDGCLDDVALFDGVLGQAQIQAIMDGDFSDFGIGAASFAITEVAYDASADPPTVSLTFTSRPGKTYAVDVATEMLPSGEPGGWAEIDDGVESGGSTTTFVDDQVAGSVPALFYRVREF